jgi:TolA-binding protein
MNGGPAIVTDKDDAGTGPKKKIVVEKKKDDKEYYDALSLEGQGKFKEAQAIFQSLLESSEDAETKSNCTMELGRCLYGLKQYDQCVKHFGAMVKALPEHPDIGDALFLVGQSYEQLNDKVKAKSVYDRIMQLGDKLNEDVGKKTKKALRALGGA